jgi:hypothetical protein
MSDFGSIFFLRQWLRGSAEEPNVTRTGGSYNQEILQVGREVLEPQNGVVWNLVCRERLDRIRERAPLERFLVRVVPGNDSVV